MTGSPVGMGYSVKKNIFSAGRFKVTLPTNTSNMNKKNAVISGTSILLIALALGRAFISSETERHKEEERKLFEGIRANVKDSKAKSAASIDSLLKLQGRIFVYSNDTSVAAGWVPNMGYNSGPNVHSMILDVLDAENFVKKKDSLGFLLLLNCGQKNVFIVNNSIPFFNKKKGNKALWFMGFDKEDHLPKDPEKVKRHPHLYNSPFVSTWGVGFNETMDLNPDRLSNLPMLVSAKYLNKVKGYKFYMAGYERDNNHPGIDSLAFMKCVGLLNTVLKEEGVDIKQFSVSSF